MLLFCSEGLLGLLRGCLLDRLLERQADVLCGRHCTEAGEVRREAEEQSAEHRQQRCAVRRAVDSQQIRPARENYRQKKREFMRERKREREAKRTGGNSACHRLEKEQRETEKVVTVREREIIRTVREEEMPMKVPTRSGATKDVWRAMELARSMLQSQRQSIRNNPKTTSASTIPA